MTVIADSSPLQYLILLEQTALLHCFCGEVLVPEAVAIELSGPERLSPCESGCHGHPRGSMSFR